MSSSEQQHMEFLSCASGCVLQQLQPLQPEKQATGRNPKPQILNPPSLKLLRSEATCCRQCRCGLVLIPALANACSEERT